MARVEKPKCESSMDCTLLFSRELVRARCTRSHKLAAKRGSMWFAADVIEVVDEVDTRDDVDDLAVADCEHAGVAGEEQAIGFIQVHGRFELGQGPGHHLAD